MDNNHTALSITIPDPNQQSVSETLNNLSTVNTGIEDIDGAELHLPEIRGEIAITLLEDMLSDGYEPVVNEMVVEVCQ